MIFTYENLKNIMRNPHMSKTIAPNTIIIPTSENNVRVVLHGNPIYDLFMDNINNNVYMRILPDGFNWFTNTTQTRIGLVCNQYGFTASRSSKPEKHYVLTKRFYESSVYSKNRTITHFIYTDSYPFPLMDLYRREWGNESRGYVGNLMGDYIYIST